MSWPQGPARTLTYVYDAFVSYNSKDAPTVEDVSRRLVDAFGLHVWKDNWELSGGDDWIDRLPQAISSSKCVLAFVGPNGMGPWHREEIKVGLQRAVRHKSIRVIPVALPGAPAALDLPAFLDSKHIVDLRTVDDWGFHLLHCAIVKRAPGRRDHFEAKPIDTASRVPAVSRLVIDYWHVAHDRANYSIRCRAANPGDRSLVIYYAITRVHQIAHHPIRNELVAYRAPIGETPLSQTLRVPKSEAPGHAVSAPFKPARYLRSGEVEELLIPIDVRPGYRLVLSVGICWGIPEDELPRLTEVGFVAVGRRGIPSEHAHPPARQNSYSPGQHSLDLPSFVETPDWPTHWPDGVSKEEWAHYGAGETGV